MLFWFSTLVAELVWKVWMDGLDQKATGTEDLASLRHFLGVILEEDDMKEEFTQRKIFFLFFLVF